MAERDIGRTEGFSRDRRANGDGFAVLVHFANDYFFLSTPDGGEDSKVTSPVTQLRSRGYEAPRHTKKFLQHYDEIWPSVHNNVNVGDEEEPDFMAIVNRNDEIDHVKLSDSR